MGILERIDSFYGDNDHYDDYVEEVCEWCGCMYDIEVGCDCGGMEECDE